MEAQAWHSVHREPGGLTSRLRAGSSISRSGTPGCRVLCIGGLIRKVGMVLGHHKPSIKNIWVLDLCGVRLLAMEERPWGM